MKTYCNTTHLICYIDIIAIENYKFDYFPRNTDRSTLSVT